MGAWGTGPLDNDTAADFVDALRRAKKPRRRAILAAAFEGYVAFDAELKAGRNIVTPSEEDIAVLRASREGALEDNRANLKLFLELCPEYASDEAFEAHVAEMSMPTEDDGSNPAMEAVAAAWIVLSAGGGGDPKLASLIPPADAAHLDAEAGVGGQAMRAILENRPLAESWGRNWRAFAEGVGKLAERLEALAASAGRA